MSTTTRTGLVPTPKRNTIRLLKRRKVASDNDKRLPLKFEALPMPLSLRPFGGLFNPFAKGCSVLCNHPAPTSVKEVIHQLKTSLTIEGRNAQIVKDRAESVQQHQMLLPQHETDNIPEDFFRRYTDTDSRPLTPSCSVHTRTSAGSFLNRRCITPEWGKNDIIKRKKIILDLRRSHSQETLYWKPNSDLTQSGGFDDHKPKSAGANEEKKPRRQRSDEQRPKSSLAGTNQATVDERGLEEHGALPKNTATTCINENEIMLEDEDVRRGKKRKRIKPAAATTTFHLSEDPETQVAALGPDSLNPSTRPSLIPNSVSLLPNKDKRESEPVLLKGSSFLTDEAFQALKTELDVDVIENTFGRYLNHARREAIKYMPPKPKALTKAQEEAEKFGSTGETKMPRKFSKSATRFDVPLDLALLESMTPLDYLSKHVWVSQQRKQLYKRVFLKYLNKCDEIDLELTDCPIVADAGNSGTAEEQTYMPRMEYVERTMRWQSLSKALEDVLEFHGTPHNVNEVLRIIDYKKDQIMDVGFRLWCGIVSFAERLALADPKCTDSCDELEKADYNSMEQLIHQYKVAENLREVFDIIKCTHNCKIY